MPHKVLERIAQHFNFRFPIAKLSRDTGYSKSAISEFYNEKKKVSEKFILKLEEVYNIKFIDFIEDNLSNSDYLTKMIENDTIEILDRIPKEKILGYIQLNEKKFQELPSFVPYIKSQYITIESRDLAKGL